MHVSISSDMLRRTRYVIQHALPDIPRAHISEAVAASLGQKTGISLNAWLNNLGFHVKSGTTMDFKAFAARLRDLKHQVEVIKELDAGANATIPPFAFSNLKTLQAELGRCIKGETQEGMTYIGDNGLSDELSASHVFLATGDDHLAKEYAAHLKRMQDVVLDRKRAEVRGWGARMTTISGLVSRILHWAHDHEGVPFNSDKFIEMLDLRKLDIIAGGGEFPGLPGILRRELSAYLESIPSHPDRPMVRFDQHEYAAMRVYGMLPRNEAVVLRCGAYVSMLCMLSPHGESVYSSILLRMKEVYGKRMETLRDDLGYPVTVETVISSNIAKAGPYDTIPLAYVLKPAAVEMERNDIVV